MRRLRRAAAIALEDFGIRRPARAVEPVPVTAPVTRPAAAAPPTPAASDLPPGVVWQGAAMRRPELQRFVDDLESRRADALATN